MNNNLIIHIGHHKTGTTFLQNFIFPCYKELSVVRAWYSHRKITEMPLKKNILITDEGISGNPFRGNYFDEFEKNIVNIKKLYGDVKILVGFREHSSMILSLYKQHLHEKGYLTLEEFFNKQNTGLIRQEELKFLIRVEILKKHFTHIFVYLQEDLKSNIDLFITKLSHFIGVDLNKEEFEFLRDKTANVGIRTEKQVRLLRTMNILNSKKYCPNLYGTKLARYKLTPRDICQNRMKDSGDIFKMNSNLKTFITNLYNEDWQGIKLLSSISVNEK